jgi:uridylate cyclase
MGLKEDIDAEIKKIFRDRWDSRDGTVVPESEDLGLGNEAVKLEGAVLYADISGSTRMVDAYKDHFAAEVYKTYLYCAAKLIRENGGAITAYDGDRIMGVFIGASKNTSSVKCGLKINWAVREIINPALRVQYQNTEFVLKQVVGIDTSALLVARTGVRGSNDLVWVGRAANYAAKLTELDADYPTWITGTVYSNMHESVRVTNGKQMWEARSWTTMNNMSIYRSNWWWPI